MRKYVLATGLAVLLLVGGLVTWQPATTALAGGGMCEQLATTAATAGGACQQACQAQFEQCLSLVESVPDVCAGALAQCLQACPPPSK